MSSFTREKILAATVPLLAIHGYSGTSMRDVALAVGIRPSVIYHYFSDKEALFQEIRTRLNEELASSNAAFPHRGGAKRMLRQYILFRIRHREAVVALRQFFYIVKLTLPLNSRYGYIPAYAFEEVRAIVQQGVHEGIFEVGDSTFTEKAILHLIDGFLVELYPHELSARDEIMLTDNILSVALQILRPTPHGASSRHA